MSVGAKGHTYQHNFIYNTIKNKVWIISIWTTKTEQKMTVTEAMSFGSGIKLVQWDRIGTSEIYPWIYGNLIITGGMREQWGKMNYSNNRLGIWKNYNSYLNMYLR